MVKILFFARSREIVGTSEIEKDLPEGTTSFQLLDILYRDFPELEELRHCLVLAVNQEYCRKSVILNPGDEVALIPPISGG